MSYTFLSIKNRYFYLFEILFKKIFSLNFAPQNYIFYLKSDRPQDIVFSLLLL